MTAQAKSKRNWAKGMITSICCAIVKVNVKWHPLGVFFLWLVWVECNFFSIIQFISIKSSDEEMKKRHDEKEKRVKAGKRENNIDSICIIQRTKVGHYFFHVKWAVLRIGASEWDLLSLKHHTNRFYSNQVGKKNVVITSICCLRNRSMNSC